MEQTTVTTSFGVLRVLVARRGSGWAAWLAPEHEPALSVPLSVARDRDGAVRSLTWALRSLGEPGAAPAPAARPGSWEGCP